jgi:hypothetical protein
MAKILSLVICSFLLVSISWAQEGLSDLCYVKVVDKTKNAVLAKNICEKNNPSYRISSLNQLGCFLQKGQLNSNTSDNGNSENDLSLKSLISCGWYDTYLNSRKAASLDGAEIPNVCLANIVNDFLRKTETQDLFKLAKVINVFNYYCFKGGMSQRITSSFQLECFLEKPNYDDLDYSMSKDSNAKRIMDCKKTELENQKYQASLEKAQTLAKNLTSVDVSFAASLAPLKVKSLSEINKLIQPNEGTKVLFSDVEIGKNASCGAIQKSTTNVQCYICQKIQTRNDNLFTGDRIKNVKNVQLLENRKELSMAIQDDEDLNQVYCRSSNIIQIESSTELKALLAPSGINYSDPGPIVKPAPTLASE